MDSSTFPRLVVVLLQILGLACHRGSEVTKLYLHENPNFEGSAHEMEITTCHPIPVGLVNKIVSVRSDNCVVLYESDNCLPIDGQSQVIRLTETTPTRHDLKAFGFSLGSVQPCSPSSGSLSSQTWNEGSSNADDTGNRKAIVESSESEEYDAGHRFHVFRTTGRPGPRGLISEMDYGESIDTDNEEEDVDDFENGRRRDDYFHSTTKKANVNSETPLNGSVQDTPRKEGNDSDYFNVENEVPIPNENQPESHERVTTHNESAASNIQNATTETPEEVLRKYDELNLYNTSSSGEKPILDYWLPDEAVATSESAVFPIILPTAPGAHENTTSTTPSAITPTTVKKRTKATTPSTISTTSATTPSTIPTALTSTVPPVLTTEPDYFECLITCRSTTADYGSEWEVCAPFRGYQKCPGSSTGEVYWECLANGTLDDSQLKFDNCTAKWVVEMDGLIADDGQDLSPTKAEAILSQILDNVKEAGMPASPGHSKTQSVYFGHEIDDIVHLVDSTVQRSHRQMESVEQYEKICTKTVNILDALLSQERTWEQLEQTNRLTIASHVFDSVESTMFGLGRVAELKSPNNLTTSYEKAFYESSVMRVWTGVFKKSNATTSVSILETSIYLPNGWEKAVDGNTIRFVGLTLDYDYSSHLLPPEKNIFGGSASTVLGSEIVGFSLANEFNDKALKVLFLGDGVKIKFNLGDRVSRSTHSPQSPHKMAYGKPTCAYWDPQNAIWSKDGCKLLRSDSVNAICECSHLTLFAVLMDVNGYSNSVKDATLYMLTHVLCVLSSFCLLVTIIVLKILRAAKSPSTAITIQLCICLLVGNILIITVLDRNAFRLNDSACAISAGVLHYFLLSAFTWMAIEGFVVLKMVLEVFNTGTEHKLILGAVAYGLPLLVVCTLGILHFLGIQDVYGGELYCWLRGYYIFAFIGPVALVVLGNGVALAVAIHVARKADKRFSEQTKKHRTWIIGACALTSILGLTWIFGFLLLIGNQKFSRVASYVFTIFNASQGIFVFTFHCVLNRKVQTALKHCISPKSRMSGQSQSDSRATKSSNSKNETSERRVTELTSNTEEKREINVHIDTVEREEPEDEIEARRRFLRSRPSSDDLSRKPAFFKYMEQNQGRKGNDPAFM